MVNSVMKLMINKQSVFLCRLRYWHKYIYKEELSVIWTIGWYLAPVVLILVRFPIDLSTLSLLQDDNQLVKLAQCTIYNIIRSLTLLPDVMHIFIQNRTENVCGIENSKTES